MPRLAFRRMLPIIQSALFIAVMAWSQMEETAATAAREAETTAWQLEQAKRAAAERRATAVDSQPGQNGESVTWDLRTDVPPPPAVDVVTSLNAPAALTALVVGGLFTIVLGLGEQHFGWLPGGSETALLILMGVCVIVQWYLIGLWYDRRVGLAARPAMRRPGRLGRAVSWTVLVCAVLLGCLFVSFASSSYSDSYFEVSLAAWSFIAAAVEFQKIRRWQGDPSAITSLRLT